MFKVNRAGVPVELWPPIKLTKADLQAIAEDIAEHTAMPTLSKVNGKWCQRSSTDIMEYGYRIHEQEEEDDALAQINADMDEAALMSNLAEVTEGV